MSALANQERRSRWLEHMRQTPKRSDRSRRRTRPAIVDTSIPPSLPRLHSSRPPRSRPASPLAKSDPRFTLTSSSGGAGCVSSSAFSRITFARYGAMRFASEYSKIQSRAWSSSTGGSLVMVVGGAISEMSDQILTNHNTRGCPSGGWAELVYPEVEVCSTCLDFGANCSCKARPTHNCEQRKGRRTQKLLRILTQ
jgi:hypothetical protein